MAQTISHYAAEAVGGATLYYYEKPDASSKATRIWTGDPIQLPSWYESHSISDMVPISFPGEGWMFRWNILNIQPVYQTIVELCTAPTLVSLDTGSHLLTIAGGAGGDLNELTGYGVSWRDRSVNSADWGAWTADVLTSEPTLTVEPPAEGMVRQFRVRTCGSAGSSYFSGYVACRTLLSGSGVVTPVILFPLSGAVSQSEAPWLIVYCPPDPDNESQHLYVQVDGGEWEHLTECDPGQITESHTRLSNLQPGLHSVTVKMVDESENESPHDSVLFTLKPFAWTRSIAAGDVISNQSVSHQADLVEMLDALNVLRAYYGLPPIESLPGRLGRFSDWQSQISAMQQGVNDVKLVKGSSENTFFTAQWPTAAVINQLREAIAQT